MDSRKIGKKSSSKVPNYTVQPRLDTELEIIDRIACHWGPIICKPHCVAAYVMLMWSRSGKVEALATKRL